jgi:mannose-1-phosphate guanylyltransferase/phosphomannomutase
VKAVIMAGGEGTRLRPLTSRAPKPMIPLANRPMMEHIVHLLAAHGFDEVVVTVAFMADAIRNYFGDGSEHGIKITYSNEDSPLGTAGSVGNARAMLDDTFLVISGDVLTDINLTSVVEFHRSRGSAATLALKSVENPLDFGIVITESDGSISRFLEKPTWGEVFSDNINTGIYVLEPEIFDFIPPGKPVDFSSEVFPALLGAGRTIYGLPVEGYWEDVGTLEAYLRANFEALDRRLEVDIPGFRLRPGVFVGDGVAIDPTAVIEGPVVIGDQVLIGPRARIGPHAVLGSNVRVGAESHVRQTVVHDHTFIATAVHLRGCVIGRSCNLRHGARLTEGVVLGDECSVGEHAMVSPGVKVYPSKIIEAGATVNNSIVFESRGARSLFSRGALTGLANVDITPELAVRVAMAYASTLPRRSVVTTSRDSSRAARVLKRAIMVGLNASGVDIEDLEAATGPVTRHHVRSGASRGGVHVRLSQHDPEQVSIIFLDDRGIDLDEGSQRKIERQFHREDFRRAPASELGDLGFPGRAIEAYSAGLLSSVDPGPLINNRLKLIVDYSFGATASVLPYVLSKLGVDVLALNPYPSTARSLAYERDEQARSVSKLVKSSGAHLGAVLRPDGESVTLIDDCGVILDDWTALLAVAQLVADQSDGAKIAAPVVAPAELARICEVNKAELIYTKLSPAALMSQAATARADVAGDGAGGFIFPAFHSAFDAVATLVHVLSRLASSGHRLSQIVGRLPKVHIDHQTVSTPWEAKGVVMRSLVEANRDHPLVLVDGVKIQTANGWVVVVPDPEEPVTHIWSEGPTPGEAEQLGHAYVTQIRHMAQRIG